MPGAMDSRGSHRAVKAKVKSGCGTCKIRKVKCDEQRPVCRRCISTGRVCDGYGIWGGGDSFYRHRHGPADSKRSHAVPRPPASVLVLACGAEEQGYFEWFARRTAIKLPGSFASSFWRTLLLQASLAEPAVLHAVLALSSVHRTGTMAAGRRAKTDSVPSGQEQFTLQHYVKAIGHLQPHFSTKSRASFRVALVSCVVFVCLEFLRGHFATAQVHLRNGLKMLDETELLYSGDDAVLRLGPCRESTDEWIIEAFSRLHLQVELFQHSHQHPCLVLQAAVPDPPAPVFRSLIDAWRELARLLNDIVLLAHQARQHAAFPLPGALHEQQQRTLAGLAHWHTNFDASTLSAAPGGTATTSLDEEKAAALLRTYHTMATIKAATALQPRDEAAFDAHTRAFAQLLAQLARLWTLSAADHDDAPGTSPVEDTDLGAGAGVDMARSVIDMGWLPPLSYAALKCRVRRLRLQAVALLESTAHREGIWDSHCAALVARKVVEVEDGEYYDTVGVGEGGGGGFALDGAPRPEELLAPAVPVERRLREVEVVLAGAPLDRILLYCSRERGGGDCRVLLAEYSVHLRRWMDA